MPKMDGFDLCRRIKQTPELCHIPFLFYTATYTDAADEKLAMRLGASRFIVKPQDPKYLLTILKDVLTEARAGIAVPAYTLAADVRLDRDHQDRLRAKLEQKVVRLEEEIVRRTKAEQQLQQARDLLQEKVEERTRQLDEAYRQLLHVEKLSAIGKLAASFAHEFNNPLFAVTNVLKRLTEKEQLSPRGAQLLEMAYSECQRMQRLMENLKDFYRPSSGEKIPVQLEKLLADIVLLFRKGFREKNIRLVEEYDSDLPQISVVPDQFKQVFLNLIRNAAEACAENGTIILRTAGDQECVTVQVADNGKGITPERLPHIFEPFFTTKPDVSGTGLGVSVCHCIVKSHGGGIEVRTEVGVGSTFSVILPFGGN
jgi:signal transduction histidine kinase